MEINLKEALKIIENLLNTCALNLDEQEPKDIKTILEAERFQAKARRIKNLER